MTTNHPLTPAEIMEIATVRNSQRAAAIFSILKNELENGTLIQEIAELEGRKPLEIADEFLEQMTGFRWPKETDGES